MRIKGGVFLVAQVALIWAYLSLVGGCNVPREPTIRLDMSAEHDAGRFLPERGDRVGIAGSFNNWQPDSLFLSDENGDWIYTIPLNLIISGSDLAPGDTLMFKFVHHSGTDTEPVNGNWERVENRQLTVDALAEAVLVYNEPYDNRTLTEVTFTVGMSNQKVLGFFKPERGDKVTVTGSFAAWDSLGYPMEDPDGDGIYTATLPVLYTPNAPLAYAYRILPATSAPMPPAGGWERVPRRMLRVVDKAASVPFAAFNNLRRVLRVTVDAAAWKERDVFDPLEGDILQVRLFLDGHPILSDPLFPIGDHQYETAVVIPLTVRNMEWQLVLDLGKKALTERRRVIVGLEGKVIEYAARQAS